MQHRMQQDCLGCYSCLQVCCGLLTCRGWQQQTMLFVSLCLEQPVQGTAATMQGLWCCPHHCTCLHFHGMSYLSQPAAPSQKPMTPALNNSNSLLHHRGMIRDDRSGGVTCRQTLNELKSGAAASPTPSMHARPAYSDPSWISGAGTGPSV